MGERDPVHTREEEGGEPVGFSANVERIGVVAGNKLIVFAAEDAILHPISGVERTEIHPPIRIVPLFVVRVPLCRHLAEEFFPVNSVQRNLQPNRLSPLNRIRSDPQLHFLSGAHVFRDTGCINRIVPDDHEAPLDTNKAIREEKSNRLDHIRSTGRKNGNSSMPVGTLGVKPGTERLICLDLPATDWSEATERGSEQFGRFHMKQPQRRPRRVSSGSMRRRSSRQSPTVSR